MQQNAVFIFFVLTISFKTGVCGDFTFKSKSKCFDPKRTLLQIPKSSLLNVQRTINARFKESFHEYMIKPEVDQLTFNCSNRKPVLWRIYPRSAFLHLKVNYYAAVENTDGEYPFVCYTTTITLTNVNINASGSYACGLRGANPNVFVHDVGVYLYSNSDGSNDGSPLLEFNLNSTIERPIETFVRGTSDDGLIVPCTFKNPENVTTIATLRNEKGKIDQSYEVTPHVCYNMFFCIRSSVPSVLKEDVGLLSRNGGKIQCKTQNGKEALLINILPAQESVYEPPKPSMTVLALLGESYKFACRSREAIELSTDYQFTKTISTTNSDEEFYQYQAELRITLPQSPYDFGIGIDVTVACKSMGGKAKHEWNYLLQNIQDDPIPDLSINIDNGVLTCWSRAPSAVNASFVPCSTLNDCQMKSQLLYTDQAYQLILNGIKGRSANFKLLKSGISGMGLCVGFQQDIMSIFSVFKHFGEFHYVALNDKNPKKNRDTYFQMLLDKQEVYKNEFIVANCTAPLMLIISHPYWEFEFQNKTQALILPEYITESNISSSEETFFISARIQIPNLDVTGISCTNDQLIYVSPFVWKNGIFIHNADEIHYEKRKASVPIKVKESSTAAIIGLTFGILFVLASAIIIVTFYYLRASRHENKCLRQQEIDQFKQGNPELIAPGSSDNPQNVAYDESFEISLDKLDINYQCVLGSGQFGIVYKGTTNSKTQPLTVAVKAMKTGASGDYLRAMMAELKIMLYVKTHSNIVSVIGACTNNLMEHQLFIVLEFCTNGDLHTYLRRNEVGFLNFVTRGILSRSPLNSSSLEIVNRMTTLNLIQWASQIANGMAHIVKLNIIHGDLAARNVLLDGYLVAKISDFGLSKKLYQYSLYVRKRAVPVPWRWLAVESLAFTEFSSASDVWSYGVTLWEIFSLGALPYPGQEYDRNFIQMLKSGFRLPLPDYATYEIYNMILECCKSLPNERPKFDELQSQLDAMLGEYITL